MQCYLRYLFFNKISKNKSSKYLTKSSSKYRKAANNLLDSPLAVKCCLNQFGLIQENTRLDSFNGKYLFLIILKPGKSNTKVLADPMSSESPLTGLQMAFSSKGKTEYQYTPDSE